MATIPSRQKSASRIPDVDPKSPAGVALTTAVQDKLRQFLGADYTDRSLAQVRQGALALICRRRHPPLLPAALLPWRCLRGCFPGLFELCSLLLIVQKHIHACTLGGTPCAC